MKYKEEYNNLFYSSLCKLDDETLYEIARNTSYKGTVRRLANEILIDRTVEYAIEKAVSKL